MSFRLDQWGGDLLVGVEHTFSGEIERQELHAAVPDAIARMAGVVVAFAQGVTVDEALHASDFVEHGYRVSKLVA